MDGRDFKRKVVGHYLDTLTFYYFDRPNWVVVDKRSGLMVCMARKVEDAIKLFRNMSDRLEKERSSKFYIERYIENDYLASVPIMEVKKEKRV